MAETLNVSDMISPKFEPKKQFRWIMMIEGIDAYILKKAARPKISTEEQTLHWINTTRYVGGKTTFGEMQISLHDPLAPSGAQQVMEWIRLHYESVSGRSGYVDFYKRDIDLKLLDPVGTCVELWNITGAWIKDADFGGLDYSSSELSEINLTLRYDNAILQF